VTRYVLTVACILSVISPLQARDRMWQQGILRDPNIATANNGAIGTVIGSTVIVSASQLYSY